MTSPAPDLKFLQITRSPAHELLKILDNNIIGTPGHSMLYQHLGVHDKVYKIEDPYFVNLAKSNRIIGTSCFCRRITHNVGHKSSAFYIRYFSFKDVFRTKMPAMKAGVARSDLRNEISAVLSGCGLPVMPGEKFFHYAYVDPRNARSVLLCNAFGFETVRQFTTIVFDRINPRMDHAKTTEVVAAEKPLVEGAVKRFYQHYTMFSEENLFKHNPYYVVKDNNGEVLAGAQVNPDAWRILSLPGKTGKLMLNAFTKVPFLNRILNKHYKFMTLDGVYFKQGCEAALETLIESLLAKYKLHAAIIVVDPETELYTVLKSLRLGWISTFNKEIRGNVICKFLNFSDEEKKLFKSYPAYISGIDVT